MKDCHIDFETRSEVDLRKTGVYVYAEHRSTDVWCAAYAIDNGEVKTWVPGQPCPPEIVAHIAAGGAMWAHNAAFERTIWQHVLAARYKWPLPKIEQWNCTMARAYAMALPGALDSAAAALGISEAKDPVGYRTMLRMSRPRRWDENNEAVWWDDPVRIKELIAYCVQDVVVERELHARLMELRPIERDVWILDQRINDRGIYVDKALCAAARPIIEVTLTKLNHEIRTVSKGLVPSCEAVAKIVEFCRMRGVDTESIARDDVIDLLSRKDLPEDVRHVLTLRAEAGKAAVKKIDALVMGCSEDGRARGLLAYHGASTGRWAARRFQPQNIKRPKDKAQDELIPLVMTGSARVVEMIAGPPLEVVGDILRGLIIAAPGSSLYAADFSNIEGRALAWLANEKWKINAFHSFDKGKGYDLYVLAYARAFGIHPDNVTDQQRQIGKVMELALGFGGGVGAFQTMARGYGVDVPDERANDLKLAWREAHPSVKQFWYDTEDAAVGAVRQPGRATNNGRLSFKAAGSFLFMRLPSGRMLTYPYPKLREVMTPWGSKKMSLTYKTVVNSANNRRVIKDPGNSSNWARISTYGGSLVENAVQAIARDVMAEAMLRVEAAGYPVVLTVHDEIVSEAADRSVKEFKSLIEQGPIWAGGFPITAKAWTGARYRKD
jgi:DNA polymerase